MARLLDLPTELITQIISNLSGRAHDLCCLSLVSWTVHTITEPILYGIYSHETLKQAYSFRPFLRTIVRYPKLASHVRLAKIRSWRTAQNVHSFLDEAVPPSGKDLHLFIEAAKSVPLNAEAGWHELISRGTEDAEVMLLVSQLPNLQELHLALPPQSPLRWMFVVNEANKALRGEAAAFDSLKALCVENDANEGGFQLVTVAPFFKLPSLRTFQAYQCQDGSWTAEKYSAFAEKNIGKFCITSINIEWSMLSIEAVNALVRGCKALKSFKYSHHYKVGSRLSTEQFTTRELIRALENHCETLEHFRLDLHSGWDPQMWLRLMEEEDDFRLGDIRNFTKLVTLDVEQTALLTEDPKRQTNSRPFVEMMPSSLQMLTIRSCSDSIVPHMQNLSILCKDFLPQLKQVEITAIKEVVSNVITYNAKIWSERWTLTKAFSPSVDFRMKEKINTGAGLNGFWPLPPPTWRT